MTEWQTKATCRGSSYRSAQKWTAPYSIIITPILRRLDIRISMILISIPQIQTILNTIYQYFSSGSSICIWYCWNTDLTDQPDVYYLSWPSYDYSHHPDEINSNSIFFFERNSQWFLHLGIKFTLCTNLTFLRPKFFGPVSFWFKPKFNNKNKIMCFVTIESSQDVLNVSDYLSFLFFLHFFILFLGCFLFVNQFKLNIFKIHI